VYVVGPEHEKGHAARVAVLLGLELRAFLGKCLGDYLAAPDISIREADRCPDESPLLFR
jgi:hypothetical protein